MNIPMLISALSVLVIVACPVIARAAETRPSKPVICRDYEIAGKFAICRPTKAGGKPVLFRSFEQVTLADPATGEPVKVLVGFR